MKPFHFASLFLLLSIVTSCNKEPDRIKEVPDGLTPSTPCPMLSDRLRTLLPRTDCTKNHPILFNDTTLKKIILTKESEVYVTYIQQSAVYANTFGWYSYIDGAKPSNASDITLHVLFPNITEPPLSNGDKMQVGNQKFPAGTVIEFFLIEQGWQNGFINYKGLTLYTDPSFNTNHFQQHILFKEKDCGNIVLGFEDIIQDEVTNPFWDNDFNDAVFTISDNNGEFQTTSFETAKMAVL